MFKHILSLIKMILITIYSTDMLPSYKKDFSNNSQLFRQINKM